MPERMSVFFPSLSRGILWKLGAMSRVRCAAQQPRALDITPTFQKIRLRRKRREGVAIPPPADSLQTGRGFAPAQTQTPTPADISLLRAKNGLDNGVHLRW